MSGILPISVAFADQIVDNVDASIDATLEVVNLTVGNLFRYDPIAKQYIFNLSTKLLSLGLNTLVATLDDGTTHSWTITIK